uniref:Uncharacterized protein n=1 Tax=Octopus bimaculoides TaxID=37653 RepID=A0A0L8GQH4_OCTBM
MQILLQKELFKKELVFFLPFRFMFSNRAFYFCVAFHPLTLLCIFMVLLLICEKFLHSISVNYGDR